MSNGATRSSSGSGLNGTLGRTNSPVRGIRYVHPRMPKPIPATNIVAPRIRYVLFLYEETSVETSSATGLNIHGLRKAKIILAPKLEY